MFVLLHSLLAKKECGNSSVGRARPCQGRGREFESRFPLKVSNQILMLWWWNGRHEGLKIPCPQGRVGSSPTRSTDKREI